MKFWVVTTEFGPVTFKECVPWEQLSFQEDVLEQFAKEYLDDCVAGYSNLKRYKSEIETRASDFPAAFNHAMKGAEIVYQVDVEPQRSETYPFSDRFRALDFAQKETTCQRRYVTEYDSETSQTDIIYDRLGG